MPKNAKQFEQRPWGTFEVLTELPQAVVKKIEVNPMQRLSYQSHKFRQEHWVIVQGRGKVVLDGQEINVGAGDKIDVGLGVRHRIMNMDEHLSLIFIEVSSGQFDEFDEIRHEDDYGRGDPK